MSRYLRSGAESMGAETDGVSYDKLTVLEKSNGEMEFDLALLLDIVSR